MVRLRRVVAGPIGGRFRLFGNLGVTPSRVLIAALFVAAGYALFSAAGYVLRSYDLGRRETELRREVAELQRERAELEALRAYLQSDEYVEYSARKLLGLVRPGETLVVVSASPAVAATPSPTPGASQRPWWRQLYGEFWSAPAPTPAPEPSAAPAP
jgi:cell division protein FtsB